MYVKYCSWQWTLDTEIVTPWEALRGTGKEEGNVFRFPRNAVRYVHKITE